MIEFLLISIVSTLIGYFFIWINISRLALIPGFFLLLFTINSLGGFSLKNITEEQLKNYGANISRSIIIIGIIILLINQGLVWYHVISITVIINIILYLSAYQRNYHEGKSVFIWGMLITFLVWIWYVVWNGQYNSIANIISLWSISFLILFYSMPYLFKKLSEQDQIILSHQRELALYVCLATLIYWIFQPNYHAVIVSQLAFITLCIGVRQTYLTRKKEVKQEKKSWLNGRSLLAWQKVLERYDDQNKSLDLHIFNFLINNEYMPSAYGMKIMQYSQIILILLLITITLWWLFTNTAHTLLWYRLGILCFIITLFGIQSQEKFVSYYKTIAIWLITGSYYITLFDTTRDSGIFTRGSLIWLCLNMITCLFYDDIFPKTKYLFTKNDILFWLSMIIIGGVITTLSLVRLPLNWSILFALWCIIIGMVSYFAYHIWKKIN